MFSSVVCWPSYRRSRFIMIDSKDFVRVTLVFVLSLITLHCSVGANYLCFYSIILFLQNIGWFFQILDKLLYRVELWTAFDLHSQLKYRFVFMALRCELCFYRWKSLQMLKMRAPIFRWLADSERSRPRSSNETPIYARRYRELQSFYVCVCFVLFFWNWKLHIWCRARAGTRL